MENKGWLALDIDGTLTASSHVIPSNMIEYLRSLTEMGWKLVILTGRSLSFALPIVAPFSFPYFLSVQNGSAIVKMPSRELFYKNYLTSEALTVVHQAVEGVPSVVIIYEGLGREDFCHIKGHPLLSHLQEEEALRRIGIFHWSLISHIQDLSPQEMALIKCMGSLEAMETIQERIFMTSSFQASLIRNPLEEEGFLLLITAEGVSKGSALRALLEREGKDGPVIAAGNDDNDLSLLKAADFAIAMEDSPQHLLEQAHLIAPSPKKGGLLEALPRALQMLEEKVSLSLLSADPSKDPVRG